MALGKSVANFGQFLKKGREEESISHKFYA